LVGEHRGEESPCPRPLARSVEASQSQRDGMFGLRLRSRAPDHVNTAQLLNKEARNEGFPMTRASIAVGSIIFTALAIACGPADMEGTPLASDGVDVPSAATPKSGSGGGAGQCVPKGGAPTLEATDPSTFPKTCCDGKGQAHCVPKEKLPASFAEQLDA